MARAALLGRMPRATDAAAAAFANLRCYYGFMWGHPGKKLLFMGDEFGQWREWSEDRELDWWLLQYPQHQGLQALVRDLNRLHRRLPALHAARCRARGLPLDRCRRRDAIGPHLDPPGSAARRSRCSAT